MSEFEEIVLNSVKDNAKPKDGNDGYLGFGSLRHFFQNEDEQELVIALQKLVDLKYLDGHAKHTDGSYGAYRLTPQGNHYLKNQRNSPAIFGNITNSNVALNSPGILQTLNINDLDDDLKERVAELQEAINKKDKITVLKVFGYILDKSVDVGLALLTGKLLR